MDEQELGDRRERDSLSAELDSMRQIARILDSLRDEDARQRVLQWARDRYRAALVPETAGAMRVGADTALQVDELDGLFDVAPAADPAQERAAAKPRADVESMIKDFAADFRRFAVEWQGA